jgi:hypothetical protein
MIAVDHWRTYLQHSEFILKTDHKSLLHLDDQRLTTPWQHKALTKLMGLNFKILYKKGSENSVAGAQSRASHQESTELAATSALQSIWLTDLQTAYIQDPELSEFATVALCFLSSWSFLSEQWSYQVQREIVVGITA